MAPELLPFLERELHVDCYELGICAAGVLSVEDDALVFSAAPELRARLDRITGIAVEPDVGPRLYSDMPDLAVFIDGLFVQAWKVLRAPDLH